MGSLHTTGPTISEASRMFKRVIDGKEPETIPVADKEAVANLAQFEAEEAD
jgi:hypothetical protein